MPQISEVLKICGIFSDLKLLYTVCLSKKFPLFIFAITFPNVNQFK